MSTLDQLHQGVIKNPADEASWLTLADWLEANDDPRRGEMLRLHRQLIATCCEPKRHPKRDEWQTNLVKLLQKRVRTYTPQRTVELAKGVEMTFSYIPPGTFLMGSPEDEEGRYDWEPLHKVTLTKGYYLGVHPVTQAQWLAVMGENPSHFTKGGMNCPVDMVSALEVKEFCNRLKKIDGKPYRLPTEAEWEYACRAGTTTPFFFGPTISSSQANYNGNSIYGPGKKGKNRKETTPVETFPANAWGLFDMHGNIWEWCSDVSCDYQPGEQTDPKGPARGTHRMLRGSSREAHPNYLRSASRADSPAQEHSGSIGCRIAVNA